MAMSQKQLVERWDLTPGRVSQLVADGCPLSSFEDAEKWRAERHTVTGRAPSNFRIEPSLIPDGVSDNSSESQKPQINLETFDSIIERQRLLVQLSRNQYIQAVKSGSPQQSKLYASYDKTVNTLTKLKAEADRLAILSREYIKRTDSEQTIREILSEVLSTLDKVGLECAEKVNSENPAMASKVLDAWARSVRERLSHNV